MDNNTKYPCIIPTLPEDYLEMRKNLYLILEMLSMNGLIFIGSDELEPLVFEDAKQLDLQGKVGFINENDIISFDAVETAYSKRLEKIKESTGAPEKFSRTGWYYQQFLKMEYSRKCDDEYYFCWDADTIPLRPIEMFNPVGIPYLDTKTEYSPSYFDTLNNLLGLGKVIEQSFISEHMLFKTNLMSELIEEIMETRFEGETFYEKILSAVNQPFNGFSEFETYGTWIAHRHSGEYRLRQWKSLRNTNFMIGRHDLTDDDLKWLATGFDAVSFERYQETEATLTELFRNHRYREKLSADIFYQDLLEAGMFGEYRNGGLVKDGCILPV